MSYIPNQIINVKDFMYSSLQTVLTAIGSQTATLLIPTTVNITTNTTIPANVNLSFANSGNFNVSNGVTLTIKGGIDAGLYQIFTGAGTVVGTYAKITHCHPEWFGAKVGDTSVDNAPIFDKAQRFFPLVKLSIGTYYFSTLFKTVYSATFEGVARTSDLGSWVNTTITQLSDLPTIQLDNGMFTLRNLTVSGVVTNTNNYGIYFPSLGSYSVFEQVRVYGCGSHGIYVGGASSLGVDLCEFKHVKCEGNYGYGVKIDMTGATGFNTSKFELVECTTNHLGGFYLDGCRSLVFERCHAFWNANPDSTKNVYGYTIHSDKAESVKFINCWSESHGEHNYLDPSHKSGGFLLDGGINISFNDCHIELENRGFTINKGTNIIIDNPDFITNGYASCYNIYMAPSTPTNPVIVMVKNCDRINYPINSTNIHVIANFSSQSFVEYTTEVPTWGRITYNAKYKLGQMGESVCTTAGTFADYQISSHLSAIAGNTFASWTTDMSFRIGDNILIPNAGAGGAGLYCQVTDVDMVNNKCWINKTIGTTIAESLCSTTIASLHANTHASAIPTTGTWQIGDKVHNLVPTPGGYEGWACTTAGVACGTAWAATTAYALNSYMYSGIKVYQCTVAGTSGSTAPTASGVDGTVTWTWVGPLAVFKGYGLIQS